jgi:hypothetical protein
MRSALLTLLLSAHSLFCESRLLGVRRVGGVCDSVVVVAAAHLSTKQACAVTEPQRPHAKGGCQLVRSIFVTDPEAFYTHLIGPNNNDVPPKTVWNDFKRAKVPATNPTYAKRFRWDSRAERGG